MTNIQAARERRDAYDAGFEDAMVGSGSNCVNSVPSRVRKEYNEGWRNGTTQREIESLPPMSAKENTLADNTQIAADKGEIE